jgi:hypothetical protein
MMDIVDQIEAILDRATQDFDGRDEVLRRAADEIKSLRAAVSIAWLYDNEDTGREIGEQHPVESGEVPDATNVVAATASALHVELSTAWEELEQARARERDSAVHLGEPVGYLKPISDWAVPPFYIPAEERTEEWSKNVYTDPVHAPSSIRGVRLRPLRFAKAKGQTREELRANVHKEPLYAIGDTVLVWVSEGDLIEHQIAGSAKEVVRGTSQ